MTSAVLYGTTSDNELRPVQVTDSGEFVTDGGGGGDWYENFYVGGTEGAPSISLLSDGSIKAGGDVKAGERDPAVTNTRGVRLAVDSSNGGCYVQAKDSVTSSAVMAFQALHGTSEKFKVMYDGTITATGVVYAANFIPSSSFDINKIGQALSTIYDVIDSVDDLQGLKNLFHLLLDNLKSDPTPPPPTPPEPPEPPE